MDNEFEEINPNTIELLGFVKNDIVNIIQKEKNLPLAQKAFLTESYNMLNKVQEYLFNS